MLFRNAISNLVDATVQRASVLRLSLTGFDLRILCPFRDLGREEMKSCSRGSTRGRKLFAL
jgi:hypothetical protein